MGHQIGSASNLMTHSSFGCQNEAGFDFLWTSRPILRTSHREKSSIQRRAAGFAVGCVLSRFERCVTDLPGKYDTVSYLSPIPVLRRYFSNGKRFPFEKYRLKTGMGLKYDTVSYLPGKSVTHRSNLLKTHPTANPAARLCIEDFSRWEVLNMGREVHKKSKPASF